MQLVKNIGDIDVYNDENFVSVKVDGETVLTIPREGHGLDVFVDALRSLVIK